MTVTIELRRDDPARTRAVDGPTASPGDGEALLRVDAFGLSTNNLTYADFGDELGYWRFFPADDDGWGRLPVWGFGDVVESRADELDVGRRVYGYFPMSSHLVVAPDRVSAQGFTDGAAHRADLPPAYNRYLDVAADPAYDAEREPEHLVLRPLYLTSFVLDDFVVDRGFDGATVLLSSASSKTALGTAWLARRRGARTVALTSAAHEDFLRGLDVHDVVLTYDRVDELPLDPTVYVDLSGADALRRRVHERYGDDLVHSAVVGATHRDAPAERGGRLPGAPPTFFFAPDRIVARSREWGADEFERRFAERWRELVEWTDGWLTFERATGPDEVRRLLDALASGTVEPDVGHVASLVA